MRTLSFLLFLGIIYSCSNQSPAVAENVNLDGFTSITADGVTQVTRINGNGNLEELGYLIDGAKNGTWMTYHASDKRIKTLTSYANGLMNGPHIEFSKRGQMEKKVNYLNNNYHGVFATYKNGRAEKEMLYDNGVLTGTFKEYDKRGNLQKETDFKDGKPHGKMSFYDDGKLLMEYQYENGEKVSGGIVENQETPETEESAK